MNQEPKFTTSHCGKKLKNKEKRGRPSDGTIRAGLEGSSGSGQSEGPWEDWKRGLLPLPPAEGLVLTQWNHSALCVLGGPDSEVGRLHYDKLNTACPAQI